MEPTKKEVMLAEMVIAQVQGKGYYIEVTNKDMESPELIINPKDNVAVKREYYSTAYNDDLQLVHNTDIAITGHGAFTKGLELPSGYFESFSTNNAPFMRAGIPKGAPKGVPLLGD